VTDVKFPSPLRSPSIDAKSISDDTYTSLASSLYSGAAGMVIIDTRRLRSRPVTNDGTRGRRELIPKSGDALMRLRSSNAGDGGGTTM